LRRHLTYANVMSTLGVFLALAGGYAIAKAGGEGSSVRSAQVTNLGPDYKTILKIPGLGKVQTACINGDETMVAWKTGQDPLRVLVDREDGSFAFHSNAGSRSAYEVGLSGLGAHIEFHVFRRQGQDTPQTFVSAAANDFGGDCASNVAAEAISTK
jgi:hypothetical protein